MFKLRDYQIKAKEDIRKFLFTSKKKKGILVSPVGSGKAIYTAVISELLNEPTLVIQPSKELLEQNLQKANAMGIYPTVYSASLGQKDISNLTYATPQSIAKHPSKFSHIKYVVIDESHSNLGKTFAKGRLSGKSKLIEFLEEIDPLKVIGLTATPVQLVTGGKIGEGSRLVMMNRSKRSYWLGADIFHVTQIQDICDKYWSDITIKKVEFGSKEILKLNSNGTDFTDESMSMYYEYHNIKESIREVYRQCIKQGRKSILTFVPSIPIAFALKNFINDSRTCVVTGETDKKERERILDDFRNGNIRHVISINTLTTGFDMPRLDTVIMARETNSFSLYYQMFGRLVRPVIVDGNVVRNKDLLIDFTGNGERFGDVRKITFEDQKYVGGWAMFGDDRLITGLPVSLINKPFRSSLIKDYQDENNMTENEYHTNESYYMSYKFPFGKFKDKTVAEVANKSPGYLSWMIEKFDFTRNKDLKRVVLYFVKKEAKKYIQ